ncbi:23S rRNA (guanosine(2251)-2'-O)-methyltransferase RlmB [Kordiimonas marina]|uniref:23S rRNA (guanosine(2251)-2'-O)-methyltransferase RlmB n=1 Tax=Kordiimonas marina TaxID=2872312 RepID=UPI001FF11498|nr:23S rRNA (guanosine(2251)-2'-O)-methyltransferase RlmB [Kordiimonas marina]MCJ9430800.1 23S rRNA (guanosine(2251)-2'-O)-methyltransferase RlmB [Kordiimonas marina]
MSKKKNNKQPPARRPQTRSQRPPAPDRHQDRQQERHQGGHHASQGGKSHPALSPQSKDGYFLFGRHAVEAALKNPNRECVRLIGLEKAITTSGLATIRPTLKVEIVASEDPLRAAVPSDSPHQGVLLEVRPLPGLALEELTPIPGEKNILLMLDQVTDPHNVGACLRSAAAFGARAVITQDRHSPGESGTLARSSSGGLEVTPWVRVINLAQALETLKDMGYWHVGLDGSTDVALKDVRLGDNVVIVMGSEGHGLRPLTRKHCDAIAKIPMTGLVESLNVSNAAAIALYQFAGL